MSNVLYYSEEPRLLRELGTGAETIAGVSDTGCCAVVFDESAGSTAYRHALLLKSDGRIAGDCDRIAGALAAAAKERKCPVIVIGATRMGRQVAAKLAVRAGMHVLSDVHDLKITGGALSGVRDAYAGRFTARVTSGLPCIALVPPGSYDPLPAGPSSIEEMTVAGTDARIRLLESRPKAKGSVDLKSAEIIVAAGRGFRKKEDLALAQDLASVLGGALGGSRPLSSDLDWLGEEHHIGLTGIYVRPKLYVAVGISGQLQHVAGIRDSRVIVAVNKDKQAPIFQVSDYGIVGDLYSVLPALMRALAA